MADIKFGRLIAKDRSYEQKYSLKKLLNVSAKKVERVLKVPGLAKFYDQGDLGACVGYSSSWMMSIYNNPPTQKYDGIWLYHEAQLYDNDPTTNPLDDSGTYVWAAFEVLRQLGHKKYKESNPDINDGILSYYWGQDADDGRTAIALGRPFVIGINWYEEFMNPTAKALKNWIGLHQDLGQLLGGHAICVYGASDKLQAFKLVNTWGTGYPKVWLPYSTFNRLMREEGEMCVGLDNPKIS